MSIDSSFVALKQNLFNKNSFKFKLFYFFSIGLNFSPYVVHVLTYLKRCFYDNGLASF